MRGESQDVPTIDFILQGCVEVRYNRAGFRSILTQDASLLAPDSKLAYHEILVQENDKPC